MSSQAGLEARNRLTRDCASSYDFCIFMDLRAPLTRDAQMKVVRRLNNIPLIKGAWLARVDLLTYKPADPASNTL